MSKLSAKHFLSDKGYGSGTNYTTGAVSVLMEQYATARLEAYKAELVELTDKQIQKHIELNCRHIDGSPAMDEQTFYEGAKWVLSRLNNAPEYTEAEQNCRGCMGPCGYCETKKETNESK